MGKKDSNFQEKAEAPLRKIRLHLRYDGSSYHGFQIQKNADTIQQRLQDAVFAVTGEAVAVVGCGRTDAFVHALVYVCHFQTKTALSCETLQNALAANLPRDIAVLDVENVPPEFHARYDVLEKTYEYRIWNDPVQDPFLLRYALWVKPMLDIDAMRRAAGAFLGTHDFIGFASSGFTVKTTVRTISRFDIVQKGKLIEIRITADGFLYNMVRIIVGTLVSVGLGKIPASEIPAILESRERRRAGATAKPHGLYLAEIVYKDGTRF